METNATLTRNQAEEFVQKLGTVQLVLQALVDDATEPERAVHAEYLLHEVREGLKDTVLDSARQRVVGRLRAQ